MIEALKKHWLLALAGLAALYYAYRKYAAAQVVASVQAAVQSVIDTRAQTAIANADWAGADTSHLTLADQSLYPDWYQTGDGGWVNPVTGETLSPGLSPTVAHQYGRYSVDVPLPTIDLTVRAAPAAPKPGEQGYNEVIY